MNTTPTKYESKAQSGLFFWAEAIDLPNGKNSGAFGVVSQADGFPATEAFDDWLANFADADRIAREMAEGTFTP